MTLVEIARAVGQVVGVDARPALDAAAQIGVVTRVIAHPAAAAVAVEVAWPAGDADAPLRALVDAGGSRNQRATFDAWRARPGARVARVEASARRGKLAIELEVAGAAPLADDLDRIAAARLVQPSMRAAATAAAGAAGRTTVARVVDRAAPPLASEWTLGFVAAAGEVVGVARALVVHLGASAGLVDALARAHAAAGAPAGEVGVVLAFDAALPTVAVRVPGVPVAAARAAVAAAGLDAWIAALDRLVSGPGGGGAATVDLDLRLTDEDRFQGSLAISQG